jgi:hypothetical protein
MDPDEKSAHKIGERINWEDDDEDLRRSRRRERSTHGRPLSRGSLSIHRANSMNRGDPSLALPITYRTVYAQVFPCF